MCHLPTISQSIQPNSIPPQQAIKSLPVFEFFAELICLLEAHVEFKRPLELPDWDLLKMYLGGEWTLMCVLLYVYNRYIGM